ncbi:MAG: alkaline phosphatase family protein [Hyphomicrobiaceae bacterium]
MGRAILLVLDGLRRDMLSWDLTPTLMRLAEAAESFTAHRSVFPSATRVVSSSVATGCYPAKHELSGNSLVLIENGSLVKHDAGHPDFLQHKRRVTGRSLAMPTMAERLKGIGGAIIYSNVSPGAAYAHDPDGNGIVYHRAGSFGEGRKPLHDWPTESITADAAGDHALAQRFINDVVETRKPALGVLWFAEPDTSSHAYPLGSPEHLAAIRGADANAAMVISAAARAREQGEDILLVVASDHGHQTVSGVVDVDAELVAAGLKQSAVSADVLGVSNGTSALVYVHPDHVSRTGPIGDFLRRQAWAGDVLGVDRLPEIGQAPRQGLAFAVTMAATDEPNQYGVPGKSLAAKPDEGKPDRMGCGQHGGLACFEQSPFLMIQGGGFRARARRDEPTSAVDIAPTILTYLGVHFDGLDGRSLQQPAG